MISGVLLLSHCVEIVGSFLWSATHKADIERLCTWQAAGASSATASLISISAWCSQTPRATRHRRSPDGISDMGGGNAQKLIFSGPPRQPTRASRSGSFGLSPKSREHLLAASISELTQADLSEKLNECCELPLFIVI
jgi:hypothetical protein